VKVQRQFLELSKSEITSILCGIFFKIFHFTKEKTSSFRFWSNAAGLLQNI